MLRRFRQRVFDVIIKAITVSQILFVSVLDHVQRMMDIVELFLRQIDLLRRLSGGVRNEMMLLRFFASKDTFCERT